MIVDIKCGICKLVFPIKREDYLKRALDKKDNYRNRIVCPSCWSEMPSKPKKLFDAFIAENGMSEWELGTRHQESENCNRS